MNYLSLTLSMFTGLLVTVYSIRLRIIFKFPGLALGQGDQGIFQARFFCFQHTDIFFATTTRLYVRLVFRP